MIGALADGRSTFRGFLESEDCLATKNAFEAMGVSIQVQEGKLEVDGVGLLGLKKPAGAMDLGNSGTSMRILLGILAGQNFEATLTGDESLCSRPMRRVTHPIKQMGAQIKGRDKGNFAPLTIRGGKLRGIDFENKLLSAQVKSAIVFAGLYAETPTVVREPIPSRDHTEIFLKAAQAPVRVENNIIRVSRASQLTPIHCDIPGDPSAAAFFVVGAAIQKNSRLTIENVCLNPTRCGWIDVLKRMGAQIDIQVQSDYPEKVGVLQVQGSALKGTRLLPEEIPSLIDEIPILMVAMALADGESMISGAEELRVKETDRIHSMVSNLSNLGADLEELPDGCMIRGVSDLNGGEVTGFGDHRTVMSMAIASLRTKGTVQISDVDCVKTSFPSFFESFSRLRKPEA